MKSFRNPYLASLMAFLILFSSCNQSSAPFWESDQLNVETLQTMHDEIRSQFSYVHLSIERQLELKNTYPTIESELISNLKIAEQNGIEALFNKYDMDLVLLEELKFFLNNESNESIYKLLLENFQFKNIDEAKFLFYMVETYKLFESNLPMSEEQKLLKGMTWGCALALAGTVAVTAGAAFVTGGASLIIFLVSKGLATANIISACS